MTAITSIAAYREAVDSGLICQRQMQVLEFVIEHDNEHGVSQGDAGRAFNDASSSFQPRFRELEDSGLIRQVGTKKDSVTGKTVKCYRPTGLIPTKRVQRKSKFIELVDSQTDYWQGLYIDGSLKAEGQPLTAHQVLTALELRFETR